MKRQKFMHKNVANDKKFMHKNVDMERKAYRELLRTSVQSHCDK